MLPGIATIWFYWIVECKYPPPLSYVAPPLSLAATPAAITPAIAFEDDGTQGDGAGAAAGDLADDGDVLDGEGDEGEEEEGEDGGRGGRRVRPRVSRTAASSRAGGRGRRSGRRGGAQQQQEQDEGGEEDGSGEREAVDLSSAFVKYDRLLHGERRAGQPAREILTRNFLRKFIHYARLRTPVLSNQVRRKASNGAGHKAGAVMASVDAQVQDIRGSEGSCMVYTPVCSFKDVSQKFRVETKVLDALQVDAFQLSTFPTLLLAPCLFPCAAPQCTSLICTALQASEKIAQAYAEMRAAGMDPSRRVSGCSVVLCLAECPNLPCTTRTFSLLPPSSLILILSHLMLSHVMSCYVISFHLKSSHLVLSHHRLSSPLLSGHGWHSPRHCSLPRDHHSSLHGACQAQAAQTGGKGGGEGGDRRERGKGGGGSFFHGMLVHGPHGFKGKRQLISSCR